MHPKRLPAGLGQESVWDYPRPPKLESTTRHIQVIYQGITIADTRRALRVLETSHPPVYYLPPEDIRMEYLLPSERHSFCEWKGLTSYYHIQVGSTITQNSAWYYPDPVERYAAMKDHIAFYPQKMEACYVDSEIVRPQPGHFYGGWITSDVIGPFKGGPGTEGW